MKQTIDTETLETISDEENKGGSMRKHTLMVLGLVLLAGLAPVFAQSSAKASFDVPFEFVVGNVTLPAGEYIVDYSAQTTLLTIRNAEGGPTVHVLTTSVDGKPNAAKAKLLFNRYGAKNFLSQMWAANGNRGCGIAKTSYEREIMAMGLNTGALKIAAK